LLFSLKSILILLREIVIKMILFVLVIVFDLAMFLTMFFAIFIEIDVNIVELYRSFTYPIFTFDLRLPPIR